jgi:hypothetical protein
VPWVQPWRTAAASVPLAMPKNASTDRRNSGIRIRVAWQFPRLCFEQQPRLHAPKECAATLAFSRAKQGRRRGQT